MLLAVDFHEDLIDEERIAIAPMLSFQSSGVYCSKLDAPKTYCFATDCDTALRQKVFDISVAQIEAMVKPNGITDNVGRESMSFVCIHLPILSNSRS